MYLALVGDEGGGGDEVDGIAQAGLLRNARQQRRSIIRQIRVLLFRLESQKRADEADTAPV